MSFYQIVVPIGADRRNLVVNPSFEIGTAGWGTLQGGTVGTTSAVQAFGAWCGSVAPSSNGTAGVLGPAFTAGNGTAYGFSFYGSFPVGSTFRAGIGDASGNSLLGSFIGTGGGSWHRYMGSFTESAGASRRLAIRKNGNAATDAFYVDAVQYEVGSVTTYIDGDQGEGYLWDGAPHASTSLRAASVRTGGTVYDLGALGFTVLEHAGVGMPDVTAVMQDYAIVPGAFYQRTHVNARSFLLTGLMSGTTFQHLHALRQQVINTIRPDLTPEPQPFRILYTGAGGSVFIDGIYDSGLQLQSPQGFAEVAAWRIVAPDPYWQTVTERGTSLSPLVNLGSTNFLAYRDPAGRWGTLGVNGTTVQHAAADPGNTVRALAYRNGTLYIAGGFGTIGGTSYPAVGFYANGVFGTFPGGTVSLSSGDAVRDMALDPQGTIYVGGVFTSASGSTAGRFLARYTSGSWLPLSGGTIASAGAAGVLYLYPFGGTMFVSGNFSAVNGTALDDAAMYNTLSGSWGSMGIPATGGPIIVGPDSTVYIGTHRWQSPTSFTSLSIPAGRGFGTDAAGVIYASGGGDTFGGVAANGIAAYNGIQFTALGSGILAGAGAGYARRITQLRDGRILVGGSFTIVNGNDWFPRGLAYWRGNNWMPADLSVQTGAILDAVVLADGGLYVGGTFQGTAQAASVTTVIASPSGADTSPRLVLRTPASGTARVFQFMNTTTNDAIWMNLVLQPTEVATLQLAPGAPSFTSNLRGLLNTVLPGSNLARWRLKSGTNTVSFFADNSALQADLIYRPRLWSADGTA